MSDREPRPLPAERPEPEAGAPLRFPGNVAADIEGRLVVSDTGHHRILVGHMVGNALDVRTVVGRGEPGFEDGPLGEAAFREPQGLAFSGDMVIVADRGNHAIRVVDLAAGRVATMAGTGEPARGRIPGGDPLASPLDSPWDVLLHEHDLFLAMASSDEIWRLDLRQGALVLHAGKSTEVGPGGRARRTGPMALATDGQALYFADAGSSSVRRVGFEGGGVETLVGTGPGDREGPGEGAWLGHPGGLAWGQGNHRLWIADTGNHR
ncbi:MAG TPA: hypothetical protein VM778_03055, partial [Gemmatimonadota bacterium]|nr:hypothetical protein [Gemmatimonadota bacterium]